MGFGREKVGQMTRTRVCLFTARALCAVVLCVVLGCTLAGCVSGGAGSGATPDSKGSASVEKGASGAAGQAPNTDIPPGRGIAEGGGGPMSYTFREEWRRAVGKAQAWRSGAYLISAAGVQVNNDGVPSHWAFNFIDQTADAVLLVEIDPWGKVTQTREVKGGGVSSFVGEFTKQIPYEVIDSDKAVAIGRADLASRYDLTKTKDPRLGLNISEVDGTGPYWSYTLLNTSTAKYVTARINAVTGELAPAR
jgi:hypothetical protein